MYNYHKKTVHSACEIVGVLGKQKFADLAPGDVMRRVSGTEVRSLSELFPEVEPGCLLEGGAPERLQTCWEQAGSEVGSGKSWIY